MRNQTLSFSCFCFERVAPRTFRAARRISFLLLALGLLAACSQSLRGQELPWSQKMANTTIQRWTAGRFLPPGAHWGWNYELGTLLQGMDTVWYNTADRTYYNYMKQSVDQFIGLDGSILTYRPDDNSLDDILLGRQLLILYGATHDVKYYKAATLLRQQLLTHPRTPSGGFWHKGKYPQQMWLDGLYMAEPFYAEYAVTFQQPDALDDVVKQFVLSESHMRDPKTGLLYHGWDESKQMGWANKTTGDSSIFWSRSMGWYMMALVDTIPYFQDSDPRRATLLAILSRLAAAVVRYQDPATGLWYQVTDRPTAKDNYLESSAACMFVYALGKGVRFGFLPPHYLTNAQRAYQGILKHFIQTDANGMLTLTSTVRGVGLESGPDGGTYDYYVHTPVIDNDPKGIGAFLLASTEMEDVPTAPLGRGKTALLDAWFNSQKRQDAAGHLVYFHYKWNERGDPGYWFFGHIWHTYGVATKTLTSAPTLSNLAGAQFYIIASPDIPSKNPNPNYVQPEDVKPVVEWVRRGGVLVILENDGPDADIDHMNLLSDEFGIHFNNVDRNLVDDSKYTMGEIDVSGGGPLFHSPHKLFMKEISTITPSKGAVSLLTDKGDVLMAVRKFGRGTVFAMTDPWLYNEYTDGRKLPADYDNFAGGREFVRWLVEQLPAAPHPAAH
jgi:unsaturated rhamnogalacturonyl hydrolase